VAKTGKPNILFILADDIGWFKRKRLQPRCDGLPHAEHRQDRSGRRHLHRLLPIRTEEPEYENYPKDQID
jgi:hypothetical protein